jgi:hypothetical protein
MENCKFIATPLETNSKLCKLPTTRTYKEIEAMKEVPYRKLVNSLMYVMVAIGLDLSNAINVVNQFMQDPSSKY